MLSSSPASDPLLEERLELLLERQKLLQAIMSGWRKVGRDRNALYDLDVELRQVILASSGPWLGGTSIQRRLEFCTKAVPLAKDLVEHFEELWMHVQQQERQEEQRRRDAEAIRNSQQEKGRDAWEDSAVEVVCESLDLARADYQDRITKVRDLESIRWWNNVMKVLAILLLITVAAQWLL